MLLLCPTREAARADRQRGVDAVQPGHPLRQPHGVPAAAAGGRPPPGRARRRPRQQQHHQQVDRQNYSYIHFYSCLQSVKVKLKIYENLSAIRIESAPRGNCPSALTAEPYVLDHTNLLYFFNEIEIIIFFYKS